MSTVRSSSVQPGAPSIYQYGAPKRQPTTTCWQASLDHELALAWQQGDRHAGDLLVRRNWSWIEAFFRSRAPKNIHEDLRQRTLVGLTRSISKYRGEAPFRSYLYAIARFTLWKHISRTENSKGQFEAVMSALEESQLGVEAESERSDILDVRVRLQRLSPRDREILVMYYWLGLTNEQIARILDLALTTTHDRRVRATRNLATLLSEPRVASDDSRGGLAEFLDRCRGARPLNE